MEEDRDEMIGREGWLADGRETIKGAVTGANEVTKFGANIFGCCETAAKSSKIQHHGEINCVMTLSC